jgi:hypothetical protein
VEEAIQAKIEKMKTIQIIVGPIMSTFACRESDLDPEQETL